MDHENMQGGQGLVEEALREAFKITSSDALRSIYLHHFGWGAGDGSAPQGQSGKFLRSVLAGLGCRAMGGSVEQAVPVAAAVEMVHNFSLIHDDIEDEDRFRRGRRTVWDLYGIPQATVAGDTLLSLAYHALHGLESQSGVAVQRILNEACLSMIEGQYLDIGFELRDKVDLDEYLLMIDLKTGRLIAASLKAGALVASGASASLLEVLERFGMLLGRVFQVRDDILGMWGGKSAGKPVGNDLKRRKLSLPAVYLLNFAEPKVLAEAEAIYTHQTADEDSTARLEVLLQASDAKLWCQTVADRFWEQARETIQTATMPTTVRTSLVELGEYLLTRAR